VRWLIPLIALAVMAGAFAQMKTRSSAATTASNTTLGNVRNA